MGKKELININNELNGITGIRIDDQSVNRSLKEYHENMENRIRSLAIDAFDTFNIFIKLYLDESDENIFKDYIAVKSVFDAYGKGIEISFTCSKKEETVSNFLNVFKSIQLLNFMDFYQRFNMNDYIKQSIELFTDAFKNRFYKTANTGISNENSIECMKNYFGMEHGDFEVMVSRQEIVQNIKTLADSISDSEIFKDKPELLELVVKEKNKSHDSTIVIDKFTIYRDKSKPVII